MRAGEEIERARQAAGGRHRRPSSLRKLRMTIKKSGRPLKLVLKYDTNGRIPCSTRLGGVGANMNRYEL